MMTEPTDRQRRLREQVAQACAEVVNAYTSDDKDGTMPNFHFKLGAVIGSAGLLMDENNKADGGET